MVEPDESLTLSILREIRTELRDHRTLLVQLVDASRRHDRRFTEMEHRFGDLRGELELMLKGELLGQLTHFETQMDEKMALLSDRVRTLETAR